MAGLMAEPTALETDGGLKGMKVPAVHDPM